jgi:hypothetical protein
VPTAKKYVQAKKGFTCNPSGEVYYAPTREKLIHKGEVVTLEPTKEYAEKYPDYYVEVDAQPVIVATGDRYPADHALVKGREVLFEDAD